MPTHIDIVAIDLVRSHESCAFVARMLLFVLYAKRVDIDVTRSVEIFLILLSYSFYLYPFREVSYCVVSTNTYVFVAG